MSGRHRKPSNTGRTVAKVAVTGAIIGTAGVAYAGTANAAPDSDWDQLAQCESGGNWAINTGNGFQGGLQFSPSTWSGYGGGQFAPSANQATREQQIVVAEKVLQGQGWGAWPSCSSQLGLNSGPTSRSFEVATPTPPKIDIEAPQWQQPVPSQNLAVAAPSVEAETDLGVDTGTDNASANAYQAVDTRIEAMQQGGTAIPQPALDVYTDFKQQNPTLAPAITDLIGQALGTGH